MESSNPRPSFPLLSVEPDGLAGVLEDLGLRREQVASVGGAGLTAADAAVLLVGVPPAAEPDVDSGEGLQRLAEGALARTGSLLVFLPGARTDRDLASWRNALWPLLHTNVVYRLRSGEVRRRTLSGEVALVPRARRPGGARPDSLHGSVLVARRRRWALSPDATVEKFDQNAAGWNGVPGAPGYPHFRWMRRFVGCFAPLPAGSRLLDFGCGAGWCGIEAAKRYGAAELCFFDPSPEMVRIAEANAAAAGLERASGRTGFGEAPPFPADGEEPFDAVISSGVISFAPSPERWLDGLAGVVRPGGRLVVGDIHRDSRGHRRRRTRKPLLPAREMNALTPGLVRSGLEARGFRWERGAGYQLTRPFPEAMHVNESLLRGALTWPLLWGNQLCAAANRSVGLPGSDRFDSWVMSFTLPG